MPPATSRILVTGATGLIGSSLVDAMCRKGYTDVIGVGSGDADLQEYDQTQKLIADTNPEIIVHLAALVGGIMANYTRMGEFYESNTLINTNLIRAAHRAGVRTLHTMGTGCAYPKRLEGDLLDEADLLDGEPEPTNYAYAYAKRNMLVHLMALHDQYDLRYTCLIPANIYGPHDNFHPKYSHVVPGLISRFLHMVESGADEIEIWGTGKAERDFLYIEDCCDAVIAIMEREDSFGVYNVSSGRRTTIRDLAEIIRNESGFTGKMVFNPEYPDGQSTRVMSTRRLDDLGWKPTIDLTEGIKRTIAWCQENPDSWRIAGS